MKVLIDISEKLFKEVVTLYEEGGVRSDVWIAVAQGKPFEEEFTEKEKELIAYAIDYLLGAELVEEYGWDAQTVDVLHELAKKFPYQL